MKPVALVLTIVLLSQIAKAQLQPVTSSQFSKLRTTQYLIKQDSLIKRHDFGLIEVFEFGFRFDTIYFNPGQNEINIKGKVCLGNCGEGGIPGVSIFIGKLKQNEIITNRIEIGETSQDEDYRKLGYFKVKAKIEADDYLFFYTPHFYLEEFQVGKLVSR